MNANNRPLTAIGVILAVTAASLLGMVLGGVFGAAAGLVAPDLFRRAYPWSELEPLGTAVVLGAFGGVLCGGGLGVFAIVIQFAASLAAGRQREKS